MKTIVTIMGSYYKAQTLTGVLPLSRYIHAKPCMSEPSAKNRLAAAQPLAQPLAHAFGMPHLCFEA